MNKEKLTELVYINLGRASMCWSEIPKGVFDSTKAAELGKEIMEAIEKYLEEDKEPGWSDPMIEHLDREEKESEWQRRRRLEVMKEAKMNPNPAHYESREITVEDIHKIHREMMEKEREESKKKVREEFEHDRDLIKKILADPRNADGFSDDEYRYPRYQFEGYTYILNDELTRIVSIEVPRIMVDDWMIRENLKERDKVTRKFKLEDSFKATLESAVVEDVPAMSWMDAHREDYDNLLKSGMFFELHPTWTGVWDRDKYAFCHEQRFKKK